jgi:DUF4097 and DUF4098 domain-containing protein YvlB
MRRIVLAAALAVLGGVFANGASAGSALPLQATDVTKPVTAPFSAVHVTGDQGTITVQTGSASVVKAHEVWNLEQPSLTVTVTNGALDVSMSCPNPLANPVVTINTFDLANECGYDLVVTVPASVPLTVQSGSGAVTTVGMTGGQTVQTDAGDITIRGASGDLRATAHAGQVIATDLSAGAVSLDSSLGAVQLKNSAARTVDATSGADDVTLTGVRASSKVVATSGAGVVSLAGVRAPTVAAQSNSANVQVDSVVAGVLTETAGSGGAVSTADVRAQSLRLVSATGDVSSTSVTAHTLVVTTQQGAVILRDTTTAYATLSAAAGSLDIECASIPTAVTAQTRQGDVSVVVPAGRYAVFASSGHGSVVVAGLVVDRSASRVLRAHTGSGNVAVHGS